MKPFFKRPRLITITAYLLVISLAISTVVGIVQPIQSYINRVPSVPIETTIILMIVVHTVFPLLIMISAFFALKKRRRAERVVIGAILMGVYGSLSSVWFFLPIMTYEPLSAIGVGVYRWLQFWPFFVSLLVAVALFWGVVTHSKSRKWQLAPFVALLVTTILSFVVSGVQQIATFYNNEGSRYQLGNYSDLIVLCILLSVAIILAIRRKAAEVVLVAIVVQLFTSIMLAIQFVWLLQAFGS